ncbi:benzoate 1,2-dioxygenase large subunit [Enteractinococcus helveticum]|uniref:Benzoate 1,2-dioxygenase large subunit n=1 Tax=Enteractinococcus helveticum TaxID=1837282 RepID=A0A1B7M022_9MICC|nr:benzoate 1,2-dioxygenase large subunit [Enteractinococcus helveticum]OAV61257.1 benzoate 1,2-dioxygenase large subunit [Enteractinococcus helveticum]
MTQTISSAQHLIEHGLEENSAEGVHRVDRSIFTDEEIFELEMEYIFEGNWVYLAHESQLPEIGDYFTTYIGRQPVVITRDKEGGLNCLINACAHRGAMLCRRKTDNRTTFTCPFHGWTFRNTGELLKVKDSRRAGYPENFNKDGSHDLTKVRFENYRGFLFGSLNPDVLPLEEHLGDATKIIDSIVDQSPEGLEVLKGASTYTYDGNWKLQTENGADGYHVTAVHWNYAATTSRRTSGDSSNETKAMDAGGWGKVDGGYYSFPHGHLLLWQEWTNPEDRPLWDRRDELVEKYGEEMANFMVNVSRNLCLYPNLYLMDQFSSQIRHLRPISVDKTEVTIYCIAPKGEPAEARVQRIRQYEDFFNASGMATPDDLEEFRASQKSYLATAARWNDMSRGQTHQIAGPDEQAKALGINPISSGAKTEDEGLFPIQHAYWQDVMTQAIANDS